MEETVKDKKYSFDGDRLIIGDYMLFKYNY